MNRTTINAFIKNRMEECKLNRNKAYDVANEELANEWIHIYNELGLVLKEIESTKEEEEEMK